MPNPFEYGKDHVRASNPAINLTDKNWIIAVNFDPTNASLAAADARTNRCGVGSIALSYSTGALYHKKVGGAWEKLLGTADVSSIPVGACMLWWTSVAPAGWVIIGGNISRTTYASLFALWGTTFGAGDGSTTFGTPSGASRLLMVAGAGSGLTARALGATGGNETHTMTTSELVAHSHTQNVHLHGETACAAGAAAPAANNLIPRQASATCPSPAPVTHPTAPATATNQNTGSGTPFDIMNPWIAVNVIAKY